MCILQVNSNQKIRFNFYNIKLLCTIHIIYIYTLLSAIVKDVIAMCFSTINGKRAFLDKDLIQTSISKELSHCLESNPK